MTLIVYKPGILAADSRASTHHSTNRTCKTCPNCNEETSSLVGDGHEKIVVLPKDVDYLFQGDKIKAFAGAGAVKVIEAVESVIKEGGDLKQTYESFLKFNLDAAFPTATFVFVGTTNVYRLSFGSKSFRVSKKELSDTIAIGSGKTAVDVIEHLTGGILSPVDLIIHTKKVDMTVGGAIKFVLFDSEVLTISTVEEETGRVFDIENIQKAVLDLVPKKNSVVSS